jgi:hypothetical protein
VRVLGALVAQEQKRPQHTMLQIAATQKENE